MTSIVLGFDDRPASWSALQWVADRAESSPECHVTLVFTGFAWDDGAPAARAHAAIDELRKSIANVDVSTEVLTGGLIRTAEKQDLLVVGVDADSHLHPSAAWSSGRIMRLSPAPSCFVPAGWQQRTAPVTVGIDTDHSSDVAVYFAAREAVRTGQTLRIVHSRPDPNDTDRGSTDVTGPSDMARRRLERAALEAGLAAEDSPIELQLLRENPSAALAAFADHSSMVVIGTHRRGFLAAGVLGSVARALVGRVTCPVCIVPPAE